MKRIALLCLPLLFAVNQLTAQDAAGEYRLGPKDLLEIRVLEIPELNVERRVSESGNISLPLLGETPVSGMTPEELRVRLETSLRSRFVNRANVSVIIKEYANKPISILGAVSRPGSLTVSGRWTLLQAISSAGGLTERAGRRIYILRRNDSGEAQVVEVNVADLFGSTSTAWKIPIYPSDVINVPARSVVKIYCLGEVKQPGELEFETDDRISLLSVIAKSGGLSDRASNRILIKRRGVNGKPSETKHNYKKILSGRAADPDLMADDIVVVLLSFF